MQPVLRDSVVAVDAVDLVRAILHVRFVTCPAAKFDHGRVLGNRGIDHGIFAVSG